MKRICSETLGERDDDNFVCTPGLKKVKFSLYRSRAERLPKLPTSREHIHLEDELRQTKSGQEFLFLKDGASENILVFATLTFMKILCESDTCFVNGYILCDSKSVL